MVPQSANMKCSGTRLEVSGSWLSLRAGIEKGEEMWVKEHYKVHKYLLCHSRGFQEQFPAFSIFLDPISACSPLKSYSGSYFKYLIQPILF